MDEPMRGDEAQAIYDRNGLHGNGSIDTRVATALLQLERRCGEAEAHAALLRQALLAARYHLPELTPQASGQLRTLWRQVANALASRGGAHLLAELQRLRGYVRTPAIAHYGLLLELERKAAAWDTAIKDLNGVLDAEDALRAVVAQLRTLKETQTHDDTGHTGN